MTVTDDVVQGTSSPVSGDFTLEFDGQGTGHLPHDDSAAAMKAALDDLSTVGKVEVQHH